MKVIQIHTALVPSGVGGVNLIVFGLGDDSELYQWDNKKKKWTQG